MLWPTGKPPKKRTKLVISTTHTGFHCVYWAHACMSEISAMTPVYACLLILTLALHFTEE